MMQLEMRRMRLLPLGLACLGLSLLPGCATNPAQDPVQIRLTDLDNRLGSVERVISNQSLLELSRRIDALEAQQRELRGSSEVLQNTAEGLGRQQRNLYADLDKRITALEAGLRQQPAASAGGGYGVGGAGAAGAAGTAGPAGPAGASGGAAAGAAPGSPGAPPAVGEPVDDQAAYARALELLKAGDFGNAIASFKYFMQAWPQSSLVDNAQYWIGEAFYVTRDFDQAAAAFRAVGERWPNSRKAGDALLKLGYTQAEQGHAAEARATLLQVQQRFPGSDVARLAGERLQKLAADTH